MLILANAQVARVDAASAFGVADPFARFEMVNAPHVRAAAAQPLPLSLSASGTASAPGRAASGTVLDLHYQSVKTAHAVSTIDLPR